MATYCLFDGNNICIGFLSFHDEDGVIPNGYVLISSISEDPINLMYDADAGTFSDPPPEIENIPAPTVAQLVNELFRARDEKEAIFAGNWGKETAKYLFPRYQREIDRLEDGVNPLALSALVGAASAQYKKSKSEITGSDVTNFAEIVKSAIIQQTQFSAALANAVGVEQTIIETLTEQGRRAYNPMVALEARLGS